jgi:hypothetical protein
MTGRDKAKPGKRSGGIAHPGMMGDGTEEQNLNEPGDPSARITEAEVDGAFGRAPKTPRKTESHKSKR